MGLRFKYAALSVCLVSAAAIAEAQNAEPDSDDPFASPYDDPAYESITEEDNAGEAAVDVLDLYGFRDAQQDPAANERLTAEDPPPFTPETPTFEGIPEGVDPSVVPTPEEIDGRTDPSRLEESLFEALDEQPPETVMPDEMAADSEFFEQQGVELPTEDAFGLERSDLGSLGDDFETGAAPAVEAQAPSSDEDETSDFSDEGDVVEDVDADLEDEATVASGRVINSMPGAVLRVLDKISGVSTDIEVEIGDTRVHRTLDVTVRACYQTPPEELPPESAAYLEVISNRVDDSGAAAEEDPRLFAGWMFASTPGLNAMEHAIYDVWVISCTAPPPVTE